jgi:signal transduction histidine kinase/DNA-binding response OmpR family regulator
MTEYLNKIAETLVYRVMQHAAAQSAYLSEELDLELFTLAAEDDEIEYGYAPAPGFRVFAETVVGYVKKNILSTLSFLILFGFSSLPSYAQGGSESSPMNLQTTNQPAKFKNIPIDTVTLPVVAGDDIRFTVLTGENGFPSGSVYNIARDAQGFLWFATADGLSLYDGYSFRVYRFDRCNPNSLTNNSVQAILQGQDGVLWLGTSGGGANGFSTRPPIFAHYKHEADNPDSVADNFILSIFEDQSGIVWIGNDRTLNRWDRRTDTWHIYRNDPTDPTSISTGSVTATQEDLDGTLWFGTFLDGLQSNEFNVFTAFYKSPRTGEMYFGGINGFNVFDPSRVANNPFVPPVMLTDFRLFGKLVPVGGDSVLQKSINEINALTLPYNQNDISFEFAALSYVAPAKNRYRYKLEGFNVDWREVDSKERLAVYTNLDAGNYVFRGQGTNEVGVWSEEGVTPGITILPPWWATWWFRSLVGLFFVALAVSAYSYRVRSLHKRNLELKMQVNQRTREFLVAKVKAEAANHAKSIFLENMSHELRTPLNAILGYADILKSKTETTSSSYAGLDIIKHSGEYLLTLINDILDLAKIEAGKLELVPAPFQLDIFLQLIIGIIKSRAESKDLSLTYESLSPLPAVVVADETRLRQVLLNLLGNAVKFSDEGSVVLTVQALDEDKEDDVTTLRFRVDDTGVGIAENALEQIFRPFNQAGEVSKRSQGTGLGLTISHRIVQQMGGQLLVESELGRGSSFWFDVSLPVTEAVIPQETALIRDIVGYEGARHRVLVVDDKLYNRQLLKDLLESLGFEVDTAEDGQEAIDKALNWQPAAIIMDIVMPVKSGLETTQEMRQRSELKGVLIIAVSASVTEEDREMSLQVGCDAFLPKPIQLDRLLDKLQTHLSLTWIYTDASVETEETLIAPPIEELKRLYQLTDEGEIFDIQARATQLEKESEAYAPFARQLQQLAKKFDIEQIQAFLKEFIG